MGESVGSFAHRVGVTHRAVRKRINAGHLTLEEDGTLNPDTAVEEWENNRSKPTSNGTPGIQNLQPNIIARSGAAARLMSETFKAKLAELDYKERAGELISAKEVEEAIFLVTRRVRDLLLSVSPRLSPVVAGLDSPEACAKEIDKEMYNACDELEAIEFGQ